MFRTLVKRARLTQPKKFFSEFEGTRVDCKIEGTGKEVAHDEPGMLLVHGGNIFGIFVCIYYLYHMGTKKDTNWHVWSKPKSMKDTDQIGILYHNVEYERLDKGKIRAVVDKLSL